MGSDQKLGKYHSVTAGYSLFFPRYFVVPGRSYGIDSRTMTITSSQNICLSFLCATFMFVVPVVKQQRLGTSVGCQTCTVGKKTSYSVLLLAKQGSYFAWEVLWLVVR